MNLHTPVLIIGSSFSGLATAACLRRGKVAFEVIEASSEVGARWRHHYDRLHLHTNKRLSGLPFRGWSAAAPRYPSRLDVIEYLEDYRRAFDIRPHFKTEALSVRRSGTGWVTQTGSGAGAEAGAGASAGASAGTIESDYVVMATGIFGRPKAVAMPGLESFTGRVMHSFDYRTGADFVGKRVLVVRAVVGDIGALGLRRKPYGPIEQIVREGKAPVLDIGIVQLIREGQVRVFPGVSRIDGAVVWFADGRTEVVDAIVAGVGYEGNVAGIVEVEQRRFDDLRVPVGRQRYFGEDGLYFCGYWVSPTGQIREIARDARRIAKDIDLKRYA